jgi:hypothetical protein
MSPPLNQVRGSPIDEKMEIIAKKIYMDRNWQDLMDDI